MQSETSLPAELRLAADNSAIADVAAAIASASVIALDTEFVREKTYFPELCLIQIATPELIACADCLPPVDTTALTTALSSSGKRWVLHSARQDLEVIWNLAGRLPDGLIDTQIAGALLGMAPQLSLQNLLEETLGIKIEKDQTRALWNRRPLPEAALDYALNDVRHLLSAWAVLEARLAAAERLAWFEEECSRLLAADPIPSAASLLERMRGVGNLKTHQRRAALALVDWREQKAQRRDRPRRWILGDDVLIKIARACPEDRTRLARVDGVTERLVERRGSELVAVIASADELDLPASLAEATSTRSVDKARIKALQAEIRKRAEDLGIAAELLATRRDISAIEAGRPPDNLLNGWRANLLADLL